MIRNLKLINWKSHENTEVTFDRGTNVVVGRMGSGKSSILQGLSFALFGEIPEVRSRKLSTGDLVMRRPKHADSARVEVEFETGGLIYKIKRTINEGQNDAELFKEGKLWEQGITRVTSKVQELIGIDFSTFTQVVYAKQNEMDKFLQLGKGDRTTLIDGLLKIDKMTEARVNLLSLKRSQGHRLQEMKGFVKAGTDTMEKSIQNLEKEISTKTNELENLNKHLETKLIESEHLKKSEQDLETLRAKKESLRRQKEGFMGQINTLESQLNTLPKLENPKLELERLNVELFENKKKLSNLKATSISNKRELQELSEKQKKIEIAELTLSKPFEDFSDKLKVAVRERAKINAELSSRKDAIIKLKGATANCPVCEQKISNPDVHIAHHRNKITEQTLQLNIIEKSLEQLYASQRKSEKLAIEIKIAKDTVSKKEMVASRLSVLRSLNIDSELESLNKLIISQDNKKSKLQKAVERISVESKLEQLHIDLNKLTSELMLIDYDGTRHNSLRQKLRNLISEISRIESEVKMIPEIISDKKNLLSELIDKRDKIIETQKSIKKSETAMEALQVLSNALIDVQIVIRQNFVQVVNELLGDIWTKLYPYNDYDGIRLFVEEDGRKAGDYILQLHESRGWVSVDGTASGGERSMASLSLRVAFARALSKMGMLLLDEPTHNLDSEGIEKLIEVLREGMPEVLDQVVLITHEEAMEKAANGISYKLMRESNEATVVERFI